MMKIDTKGSYHKGFENNLFLSWVAVTLGLKVYVSMSLFVMNLMGKWTIRFASDRNIKEWDRIIFLGFNGKLNVGGYVIKVNKEWIKRGLAMSLYIKCVTNKVKLAFKLEMKIVKG